jgi:hypothetical protein
MPTKYVIQRINPWSQEYTDVGARAEKLAKTPFPADLYPERGAPGESFRKAQELAAQTGESSPYKYVQSLAASNDLAKRAAGPVNMNAYMMPYLAHVGEELARSMRRTHEPIAQEMNKKFNTSHPKSFHKNLPAQLNRDLEKEIEIQKQLAMAQGWDSAAQLSKQDEIRKLLGSELLGKGGIRQQQAHIHDIETLSKSANLARAEEQGAREHLIATGMKILGYPFDLLNRYNRIVRGLPLKYGIDAIREGKMPAKPIQTPPIDVEQEQYDAFVRGQEEAIEREEPVRREQAAREEQVRGRERAAGIPNPVIGRMARAWGDWAERGGERIRAYYENPPPARPYGREEPNPAHARVDAAEAAVRGIYAQEAARPLNPAAVQAEYQRQHWERYAKEQAAQQEHLKQLLARRRR